MSDTIFTDDEAELLADFLGIPVVKVRGVEFMVTLKQRDRDPEVKP